MAEETGRSAKGLSAAGDAGELSVDYIFQVTCGADSLTQLLLINWNAELHTTFGEAAAPCLLEAA